MSKTCRDCKWLGIMKHDILTICRNKDSNWYVRNQDEAACKHFERREVHEGHYSDMPDTRQGKDGV